MDYTRCINFLLTISQHEVFLIFSENLSEFGITPGQYGVLACLWKDETLTPKEIANILSISPQTVGVHKNNLYRKLGVGNNIELLRYLQEAGL